AKGRVGTHPAPRCAGASRGAGVPDPVHAPAPSSPPCSRRPSRVSSPLVGGPVRVVGGPGMAILEVDGLVKIYKGRRVVDGVHFEVSLGEVVGLLGPNGAGKTTSFRMA